MSFSNLPSRFHSLSRPFFWLLARSWPTQKYRPFCNETLNPSYFPILAQFAFPTFGVLWGLKWRQHREEKCDVKLPWYPNFWMTTIGPRSSNDEGDSNENGQKKKRFRLAKQQLCTCFSCTFLSRRCTTGTWNPLISRARFKKWVNTTQKVSFPKLRYGPFGSNPENFAIIWHINEIE